MATPNTAAAPTNQHHDYWTAGRIAGLTVGVVVAFLLLVGLLIFAILRSRKSKKQPHHEDELPVYEKPREEPPVRQPTPPPVQRQQTPEPAAPQEVPYGGAATHTHRHEEADEHMHNESWHPSQVARQAGGTWEEPHALANGAMTRPQTLSFRN